MYMLNFEFYNRVDHQTFLDGDSSYTGLSHKQMVIISIRYTIKEPKGKKKIKINQPWDIWLKKNKGKLPYAVSDI